MTKYFAFLCETLGAPLWLKKQANNFNNSDNMIKKLFFALLAVAIITSCEKPVKNAFTINGTVDSVFNGLVLLQKRVDNPLVTIDSARLDNGKFTFKGAVDYPEVYYLTIPATKSSVPFFIESAEITVNIMTKDINKSKITGSKSQAAYDSYLDMLDQFNLKIRENYSMYNKAQEIGDEAKARYYDSLITVQDEERSAFSKKYVLQNPASFISPYIIYRNSYTYGLEDLEQALNGFDTSLSHSVYTGLMQEYLATLKRAAVGQMFIPFTMADSSGAEINVSDFVGKNYLLIDFWASWCSPCRAENPNLVNMYNTYHERGFDIFGVSFDNNRERWLGAIKADGLTWTHVSDLVRWDNAAGKLYGIRSIPSNVLLDTNGVIIGKNVMGEELQAKLAELFPAPVKSAKAAKKK
jgi:peroxiredoxin